MITHLMLSNGAHAYFTADGRVAYLGSTLITGTDMRIVRATVGQPVTIDNNGTVETWVSTLGNPPVFVEVLDEQSVIDSDDVPVSALGHLLPRLAIPD